MFAKQLILERFPKDERISLDNPIHGWKRIEKAIRQMYEERVFSIHVLPNIDLDYRDDFCEKMQISGGYRGYFIVDVMLSTQESFTLANEKTSNDKKAIYGDVNLEYPSPLCIGVNAVIQAAKTYALSGKKDRSLFWEKRFVRYLGISDIKKSSAGYGKDFNYPSKEDIELSLLEMQADNEPSSLSMARTEDADINYMYIEGGQNGRYFLWVASGEKYLFLLDLLQPDERVEMIVSGNLDIFEGKKCVCTDIALQAATVYLESGQCDPSLNWQFWR